MQCGDVVALNVPAEIDHPQRSVLASPARLSHELFESLLILVNHNTHCSQPTLSASILHALAISTIVLSTTLLL